MSRLDRVLPGLLAATLLALGGCVIDGGDRDGRGGGDWYGGGYGRTVDYRCADGRRFSVTYEERGRAARVRTSGDTYDLERQGGGRSGAYENEDGVRLSRDGERASLRLKGERDLADCEER